MSKRKFEIEADIPEGYEPTGEYRLVHQNEWFLDGEYDLPQQLTNQGWMNRRLLLRRIPSPTLKVELPRDVAEWVRDAFLVGSGDNDLRTLAEACRIALEAEEQA